MTMKEKSAFSKGPLLFLSLGKRGSIVVVVLWMLSILTIFTISIGHHVRQKITLADRIDVRSWLYGIAESGIHQAMMKLVEDEGSSGLDGLNDPWALDEKAFRDVKAGNGTFTVSYDVLDTDTGQKKTRYGVQDEESKLNLNMADPKIISRLLQIVAGIDDKKADEIAYSIADWRDTDSSLSHPDYGAEDDYYEDLKVPYTTKNAPFEVLNELLLVRGMTSEIFEKIKDKVTIYGGSGVNINTASNEVLMALGLDKTLIDKILDYRKGTDREEATKDDRVFSGATKIVTQLSDVESISGGDQAAISNLVAQGLLTVASNNFMIRSKGQLKEKGVEIDIVAVVDRKGKVLFWSAGIPKWTGHKGIAETDIAHDFVLDSKGSV